MYGQGLLKGLSITIKRFFGSNITEVYPDEYPELPEVFHGSFQLNEDKCVGCRLCAKCCPNPVIEIETVRDENNKRELTEFKVNLQYCQFCGFCIENCPTQALQTTQEFELSTYNKDDLVLNLLK
ncbi:NuoI/complex I 23 kDa subunit family protein [Selenihalanaerobacter shriftii]|uniref:NADH dehydrogenase subunit I n=1 Tax=Selenihalanaerobacter shriftii TaxID=142842 RepID=A0A1T4LUZ7_9FIRM|nr:NADH-quinone oxidoreductase subunit I [Selenihalanaerobacter shriftii]SJZ58456.1 NADH dehydrogenase subunit I [Selenihalanaerobacter shriftii]